MSTGPIFLVRVLQLIAAIVRIAKRDAELIGSAGSCYRRSKQLWQLRHRGKFGKLFGLRCTFIFLFFFLTVGGMDNICAPLRFLSNMHGKHLLSRFNGYKIIA